MNMSLQGHIGQMPEVVPESLVMAPAMPLHENRVGGWRKVTAIGATLLAGTGIVGCGGQEQTGPDLLTTAETTVVDIPNTTSTTHIPTNASSLVDSVGQGIRGIGYKEEAETIEEPEEDTEQQAERTPRAENKIDAWGMGRIDVGMNLSDLERKFIIENDACGYNAVMAWSEIDAPIGVEYDDDGTIWSLATFNQEHVYYSTVSGVSVGTSLSKLHETYGDLLKERRFGGGEGTALVIDADAEETGSVIWFWTYNDAVKGILVIKDGREPSRC